MEVLCLIMLSDKQDFKNRFNAHGVYTKTGIKLLIESDRPFFSFMHIHRRSHSLKEREYIFRDYVNAPRELPFLPDEKNISF